jgi:MoaA/NifB/PqqE/SkfB family radical SAM enzyme
LVRPDLDEILEYTKEYGIETRLLTNGTLITDKRAKELKKRGIEMLQISLDGDKKTHNEIRGVEGRDYAYDKALEGIRNCSKNGIIVTTSMTLMNRNRRVFKDVVRASEENGASFCGFQSYVPSGPDDPEFVSPEETYKSFKEARELDRTHKKIVVLQTEVMWHLMRTDSAQKKFARENNFYSGGCSAGFTGVAVLADGTVYPCGVCP